MRFCIKPYYNEWLVVPMGGEFADTPIAKAEALTLDDVAFGNNECLYGTIRASWGLVILKNEVTTSIEILKGIGVGRTFRPLASIPFRLDEQEGFCCNETNRRLVAARHVLLYLAGMFYAD